MSITASSSPPRPARYDDALILNLSSAAKIERIVDKVKSLSRERFAAEDFSFQWFRSISRVERGGTASGADAGRVGKSEPSTSSVPRPTSVASSVAAAANQEAGTRVPRVDRWPFFPFRTLLVTGTAGAGKTSSIQVLAANLNCVITGTTVIAAQNLSAILNRTRSAQVKTIYRVFGFVSKHVPLAEAGSETLERYRVCDAREENTIQRLQINDLLAYWPVIADIVEKYLNMWERKASLDDVSELCESNIIVIDECGLMLRYMLQVVVFFYYFYNALCDTRLYRERLVPCIICVGSPTQTEALESRYDHYTQNKSVRKGIDVLSALIQNEVLMNYCDVASNWIMFINNKRCTDLDFGDLLKYMEFGIPLKDEHVAYVDRFVRPPSSIRNPSYASEMTRLFLSHAEVQLYFKRLHDQIRLSEKHRLFDLPVYCVVNERAYQELCELADPLGESQQPVEVWFRQNLARIINYSQFVDHNLSNEIVKERLRPAQEVVQQQREQQQEVATAVLGGGGSRSAVLGGGGGLDDVIAAEGGYVPPAAAAADGGVSPYRETLLTLRITYIKGSSVGVNSKVRACVIGYQGTVSRFVEILQKDTFIERTPCEQAGYAYSLVSGLLFSAMYFFYVSPYTTEEALRELARIELPDVPSLCFGGANNVAAAAPEQDDDGSARVSFSPVRNPVVSDDSDDGGEAEETHDIPCMAEDDLAVTDAELVDHTDLYVDPFFHKYSKPPSVSLLSFEETVHIYTTFRDIFLKRYRLLQRLTEGRFATLPLVTYNRRNVVLKPNCQISSQTGSFVGMLSYVSPVQTYTLEGYTCDNVLSLPSDRHRIHPEVVQRGLSRLVLRDALGFLFVLDVNVSRFVESAQGKSLHVCTTIDYGLTSRTAMTIAKSQGLSLEKVAVDFGDHPKSLKMSHIYVAMSRVTDPEHLMMNVNPLRLPYEKNTAITPYICRALKDKRTTLIF
ncbi:helicase-primase helicase subunit [Panine betaherpesvirus 2]|uniref:Helicase-primase helicase subunit n=1 Tax=Panine betaherpesvirus 2 TaxID=188763 RepID=Q8QRZ6_9BETA|nr:helicase-primase helicase subunit [Panine betaherpesvirus 2]AAM00742.1 helicase-primase helicase subunit [Panine betaherpesvirus 2]QXV67853.1 helicase-primase helicase subunit [Panine betaherpesvirus 2]